MERQAGVKAVTFILSVLSELPDTAVNWSSSVPAQSVPALCSPFTGSHTLIYSAVSTPVLMIQAPFWQLSSCRHNPASVLFFFLSSHTYTPHDHSVRLQWVKEEQQPALDKSTQCAHGLVLWICPHLPLDQHSLLHSTTNLNNALNHQSTFSWVPHVLENMEHWWPVCGAVAKGLVATILCHITVSAIIPIIIYCIQCLLYSTINVNAVQCCARCLFALCFLTSWGRSDQT